MTAPAHNRPLPVASVCLLAVVALLAAGCGGESGRAESETQGSSTQTTPVTTSPSTTPAPVVSATVTDPARRAYVTRVDRECGRLDTDRDSARERVGNATDAGEAVKAYDEGTSAGLRELRELRAIPAPPGDSVLLHTNLWGPVAAQLALRRQIRSALADVDVSRLRLLREQLDNLTRQVSGFSRGYGFKVCGAG